jgi:uncharacterized protein (DUF2062 family)
MSNKFLAKYIPSKQTILHNKVLKFLGETLFSNNKIWHFNRSSVAKAFFIGIFWAFIPMPFQMVPAAIFAILFHANLPISIALVWITNPITMPPIWYATYKLGCYILSIHQVHAIDFSKLLDLDTFLSTFLSIFVKIGKPLYLGSVICGLLFGFIAWILTPIIWRLCTYSKWKQRLKNRQNKKNK